MLGGLADPYFSSAPGPLCKQCHTGVFVFGPAILEMFFLCVCPVTQDGPFFQLLTVESNVINLKSHEPKIHFHEGKHRMEGKLPTASSMKASDCMHPLPLQLPLLTGIFILLFYLFQQRSQIKTDGPVIHPGTPVDLPSLDLLVVFDGNKTSVVQSYREVLI